MPTRQAASIAHRIATELRAEADPSLWSSDLRRNGIVPSSVDELAAQVSDLAQRAQLTLLGRESRLVESLVREEAFPLVVLAEPAKGRHEAFVVLGYDRGEVQGVQIGMDGEERPFDAPVQGLARALAERARLSQPMAVPVEQVELRCLVPVSVVPTVGDGAMQAVQRAERAEDGALVASGGRVETGKVIVPLSPSARLWQLVLREKRDVLLIYGYAALAGLFSLALPLGIQQIVQLVSGRMLLQPTYILVGFVFLGTVAVGVLQVLQLAVVETIQQRIFARMALEFSFRVPRLRYETVQKTDVPETMNRFFETVNIQKSLSKILLDTSTALLTILFGLILLTLYHPYFAFFSAVLVVGLVVIFWVSGPKGLDTSLMESKYKYKAVHWLEEMARAMTAFKYAGRSSLPIERMDELVTGYLKYRKKHFKVLVQQTISFVGFKTLITGSLLILGIVLVTDNQITLGQFVASEIVIVTVLAGIEKLISSLATVYDMLTAVDKVGYVTDLPLEDAGGLALPRKQQGVAVTARGLTYRYGPGGPAALDRIDVAIRPGERVGITGYAGSGQTTLLKLFGGLLETYEGALAFDGLSHRDLDRVSLRDGIGQMLSPTDLFDGTIEENVSVGRPHITPQDVVRALEEVGLTEWVQGLPNGLRSEIHLGGRELPSHVINRLLVAQGIVGRPRLVVFDDFFHNVEPDYRRRLIDCLTSRTNPWTLLFVSNDPTFLAACDRVLVLENGRIVRDGPFDEIVQRDTFLQRLVQRANPARA